MHLLSVAGLIACKDASLFEAFSCPWPPSSLFDKLREIERAGLQRRDLQLSTAAFRRPTGMQLSLFS